MNKLLLQVLLVENIDAQFSIIENLLNQIKTYNCETYRVKTFDAAIKAFAEKPFDICLIANNSGDDTGLKLLRALCAGDFCEPTILMIGEDNYSVDLEAMSAGAAGYLVKEDLGVSLLDRAIRYAFERKRMEESLEASSKRERAVVDYVPSLICTIAADGRFVTVNPASSKMLGYHQEELVGRQYTDFIASEDISKTLDAEREVLSGREIVGFENCYRHKNGTMVYMRWNCHWSESGQFVFAVADDITERRQIEEILDNNQARFKDLFDDAPIAYHELDIAGRFTQINHTEELLLGYANKELIGRFAWEIIAEKAAEEDIKAQLGGRRKLAPVERTLIRKDGSLVSVLKEDRIIYDKNKNITGLRSTLQDITETKRANTALRENEHKLQTLIESMYEGLLQVNNEEVIEFVNDRFCEMTGYARHELLGKTTYETLLGKDERELINKAKSQRLKGISGQYEIQLRKKTGEKLWVIIGGAPIINGEGVTVGSIGVHTDITDRKRAEEQLLHDALYDGLTKLPNRTLFMDHLRLTIERGKRRTESCYAVLFLDVDRFKIVNDSLGHPEGDKLLNQIAGRLQSSVRSGDLVARFGGDEFAILLSDLHEEKEALLVAERLQECLKAPFHLSGREIFTSASIGITLSQMNYNQAEDMIRDADTAMYSAKARGKAQHQVFDRAMHQSTLKRLQLETELRYALDREEFCLYYQPIIHLETNDLVGFEALVRWNHPTRGLVPPMEFIPLAEETGLILPLGNWILRRACRQLRKWQDHNSLAPSLAVSVNLSGKQFQQPGLVDQVADILKETNLAPKCLKLEITESYILENADIAIKTLNKLRELGVEISLDDFGTGYSSLSYLHILPIDYLKIDRSFVSRMTESRENAEIVTTIIKLAQSLRMKVVAEGIETIEQMERLKKLKCEYGQGYFFSKPLKASAAALVNSTKEE